MKLELHIHIYNHAVSEGASSAELQSLADDADAKADKIEVVATNLQAMSQENKTEESK